MVIMLDYLLRQMVTMLEYLLRYMVIMLEYLPQVHGHYVGVLASGTGSLCWSTYLFR